MREMDRARQLGSSAILRGCLLQLIGARLALTQDASADGYTCSQQLLDDLQLIADSLRRKQRSGLAVTLMNARTDQHRDLAAALA